MSPCNGKTFCNDFPIFALTTFYQISFILAIPMQNLQRTLRKLRQSALAPAFWNTRESQWRKFTEFCTYFVLHALPASTETICSFVAYLSKNLELSTISNYVAAMMPFHQMLNIEAPDIGHFTVRQALAGVKRQKFELPNRKNA